MLNWNWPARRLRSAAPEAEPPRRQLNPNCKHLNTRIYGSELFAHGTCLDCNAEVPLTVVFNNWIEELHKQTRKETP